MAQAAALYDPCLMHPSIVYADPSGSFQLDPRKPGTSGQFTALPQSTDVFEMSYAYGACLMVPASVFRRIGKFDERFFLQLEETDFWIRAKAVGIRSLCTIAARVIHSESLSFGGRTTPLKTYYIVRNTFLLAEKHSRSLAGWLRMVRPLYWSLSHLIASSNPENESIALPYWLFSRNAFLVAARAAVRDYLLRKFGRVSPSTKMAIG